MKFKSWIFKRTTFIGLTHIASFFLQNYKNLLITPVFINNFNSRYLHLVGSQVFLICLVFAFLM